MPLFRQLWPDVSFEHENMSTLLDKYIMNDNYDMYCFEEEKILGFITINNRFAFFYGGNVALIEDLIVDEKHRKRGVGRKLVEFVEKELERQGIKSIELASDFHRDDAHLFWEKLGYTKSAYQYRKTFNKQ